MMSVELGHVKRTLLSSKPSEAQRWHKPLSARHTLSVKALVKRTLFIWRTFPERKQMSATQLLHTSMGIVRMPNLVDRAKVWPLPNHDVYVTQRSGGGGPVKQLQLFALGAHGHIPSLVGISPSDAPVTFIIGIAHPCGAALDALQHSHLWWVKVAGHAHHSDCQPLGSQWCQDAL